MLLEAAAAGVEIANAVAAPGVEPAAGGCRADADGPHPRALAVAALIAILTNEPARLGAELAHRALIAERDRLATGGRRPWFSTRPGSRRPPGRLWAERYDELRPLLDASIAQAPATGDSGRLAIGWPSAAGSPSDSVISPQPRWTLEPPRRLGARLRRSTEYSTVASS